MTSIEHRGAVPTVHPEAYVAPTATLCGDVHVAAGARVLFGAVLTAEDGRVEVGENTVVMEHALLRGRRDHPCLVGRDVLVGPHAHLNGATVEDGCFLATGCAVFPGARLGAGTEVRIHGVVHVNTELAADSLVPIGWVAAGDRVLPPGEHDEIWAVQRDLGFTATVYGDGPATTTRQRMAAQSAWFAAHRDDRVC